ncbi:MAG: DUF6364 family protein [Chitinophagales bacterium]|nr:DUF6364 family protein [Chitinophagales bacterium]
MQTKLTLRIDSSVVQHAKRLARDRNTSISKIVEKHLKEESGSGSKKKKKEIEIPAWIQKLGGGKKPKKVIGDVRYEYLMKKYK